jgi:hypothetical protein
MNDLPAIVSLVITVSGSTFAALLALQSLILQGGTGDSLRNVMAMSEVYLSELLATPQFRKMASRAYRIQRWWRLVWGVSLSIPVFLFLLSSFGMTVHLCIACWNENAPIAGSCWYIYKWLLLFLTVADGTCVVVPLVALFRIAAVSDDLKAMFSATAMRTIEQVPSPKTAKPV